MTEQTPPVEKHADTSCPHCDASKRLCEVLTDRRCCDHCSGDMHSGTPVGFMPAVRLRAAAKLADEAGDAVTRALLVDIADLLLGAVRHGVDGAVLAAVTEALAAATPGEPSPPAEPAGVARLLARCDEVDADATGRQIQGGHQLPAILSTSVIRALLSGGEQS